MYIVIGILGLTPFFGPTNLYGEKSNDQKNQELIEIYSPLEIKSLGKTIYIPDLFYKYEEFSLNTGLINMQKKLNDIIQKVKKQVANGILKSKKTSTNKQKTNNLTDTLTKIASARTDRKLMKITIEYLLDKNKYEFKEGIKKTKADFKIKKFTDNQKKLFKKLTDTFITSKKTILDLKQKVENELGAITNDPSQLREIFKKATD